MANVKETTVMNRVEKLLNSLEPAAQERVLNWAHSRVLEQRGKLYQQQMLAKMPIPSEQEDARRDVFG